MALWGLRVHQKQSHLCPDAEDASGATREGASEGDVVLSAHAVYLRGWRDWRTFTDGRCEAMAGRYRLQHRCAFSGAWDGKSGRVLCRIHQDRYDQATGAFRFTR